MRKRVVLLFVATGLLVATVVPAMAQRTTASLRGTITDSTHAIIPGASVTVTNQDTGLTRTVTTNTEGLYSVSELPVGTYSITVELQGFRPPSVPTSRSTWPTTARSIWNWPPAP